MSTFERVGELEKRVNRLELSADDIFTENNGLKKRIADLDKRITELEKAYQDKAATVLKENTESKLSSQTASSLKNMSKPICIYCGARIEGEKCWSCLGIGYMYNDEEEANYTRVEQFF